jgi:RNA polymerase sigma-70 factor (ECF subfamily)
VQRRRDDTFTSSTESESSTAETRGDRLKVSGSTEPLSDQEKAYLTLLFNKYRGPLYRYLSGLVRSADDVAELVQETYFRVMRHTDTVRFETVARAYLFQTATNLAHEYYRRRARRYTDQHVRLEEAESVPAEFLPEQHAVWEEAFIRLKIEMKEMPQELREVLILHRFHHRTYPEIANSLGVSTRTIERRLSQAIDFLAARMRGVL